MLKNKAIGGPIAAYIPYYCPDSTEFGRKHNPVACDHKRITSELLVITSKLVDPTTKLVDPTTEQEKTVDISMFSNS